MDHVRSEWLTNVVLKYFTDTKYRRIDAEVSVHDNWIIIRRGPNFTR